MSKPNDNKLEELVWGLNPYLESDDGSNRASRHLENTKAKAALNAYFLSQALEIVGEDLIGVELSGLLGASEDEKDMALEVNRNAYYVNMFKAELRKAFQSKYAPKEGQ